MFLNISSSLKKNFVFLKKRLIFSPLNDSGSVAQSVEQGTENPCVPGSIPGRATKSKPL